MLLVVTRLDTVEVSWRIWIFECVQRAALIINQGPDTLSPGTRGQRDVGNIQHLIVLAYVTVGAIQLAMNLLLGHSDRQLPAGQTSIPTASIQVSTSPQSTVKGLYV